MLALPSLPYEYSALEPYIDAKTMEVHHSKHHQGYVDKTNALLKGTPWENKPIDEIIINLDQLPDDIRKNIRNVGGGVLNHNFFWTILGPNGGGEPKGDLHKAIEDKFGSFEGFKNKFSDIASGLFGSGWVWLVTNITGTVEPSCLQIITTQNQDSPLTLGLNPILTLDVWEHAYYLKHQNRRPEYIEAFWQVVDWDEVAKRFENAKM